MFDDLFNTKKCMACGSELSTDCICDQCFTRISKITVNQAEIVDELTEYYKIYGYNKDEDKNKLISRLSIKVKVRKFFKKYGLQKVKILV